MILDQWGQPIKTVKESSRAVNARYDAAMTTDDNKRHWAMTDSLSAVTANSEGVRATLRERSRYEIANNSYARGMVSTIAAYTTGNGPTLQLTHHGEKDISAALRKVEKLWSNWAYARSLAEKLHTMVQATIGDGEAFAMLTTSDRSPMHTPVSLDLRVYECDRFVNWSMSGSLLDDSGVRIDRNGYPVQYAYMDEHPGTSYARMTTTSSRWISASDVIHLFRKERPEQLRGIPRTTPALELFALLRRFSLATVTAAETAANIAAILTQRESATPEEFAAWDRIEFERNALLSVPGGSSLQQMKSEHPSTNHEMFVRVLLMEIARAMGVPLIFALGTAERSNYSSARLDLQTFHREMEIERKLSIERNCLDRLFESWLDEALLIDGFLPEEFIEFVADVEWAWIWQGKPSIDRAKEAAGAEAELNMNLTTLAKEYAAKGQNWEDELRQRAKELQFMRELGLSNNVASKPTQEPVDDSEDDSEDDEEEVDEEEANEETADAQ